MTKLVRQEQTAERGMVREPDRWTDRQLTEEWIDRQTDRQRVHYVHCLRRPADEPPFCSAHLHTPLLCTTLSPRLQQKIFFFIF